MVDLVDVLRDYIDEHIADPQKTTLSAARGYLLKLQ